MSLCQFPSLTWQQGSSYHTVVEHGLFLRRNGWWRIPDYQRGLVWTQQQQECFLESLILGLPIGEYTLHEDKAFDGYEVLDGQQRWQAIFDYVDDKFPVFGLHWHELNEVTERFFRHRVFVHRLVRGLTYEERLDAYNRLAYGGTPHEHPIP